MTVESLLIRNRCTLWRSFNICRGLSSNYSNIFYHTRTRQQFHRSRVFPRNEIERCLPKLSDFQVPHTFRFSSTESKYSQVDKNPTAARSEEKIIVTDSPRTLTRAEKLKKAVKEYGSTVIVFHVGISLMSLGTCYLLVSSGMDITVVFKAVGLEDWASRSQIAASAGTFAVAYAVHKVFAPVRITITLGSVPFIVRYLRKIGFLKK
ncbi:hypothetical protein JTB14_029251 [Gonioctena quinquepunctata]|nr:hypothetical protein JTB14_029251 [Gonioctena quinquepunctata]